MMQTTIDGATRNATGAVKIALRGAAGSGKDYLVDYLRARGDKVIRAAYADYLKITFGRALMQHMGAPGEIFLYGDGAVIAWVNEHKGIPEVRSFLQNAGESVIQLTGDECYWAEQAKQRTYGKYLDDPSYTVVITDCRKLPEAEHARKDGFLIVTIQRTDGAVGAGITAGNAQHRSETEGALIVPDITIENDGTANYHAEIERMLTAARRFDGERFVL